MYEFILFKFNIEKKESLLDARDLDAVPPPWWVEEHVPRVESSSIHWTELKHRERLAMGEIVVTVTEEKL